MAERVPDRPAVVAGDRLLTFRQLDDRSARLARYFADRGPGCFAERSGLANHETGQHLLAQYVHSGPAYVEGLFGSYRADHRIELLGRDSLTVNTGGEKVFVEEVEDVLKGCPGVVDAVPRPSRTMRGPHGGSRPRSEETT